MSDFELLETIGQSVLRLWPYWLPFVTFAVGVCRCEIKADVRFVLLKAADWLKD